VVLVDKSLAFDKRGTLTLTGDRVTSDQPESTQNRLVFEDEEKGLVMNRINQNMLSNRNMLVKYLTAL
jgi:hypothetical protein